MKENAVDLHSLIGKKIIRMRPFKNSSERYGFDYSYCLNGKFFFQPNDWVNLISIDDDGNLIIKTRHLSSSYKLEREWNDGAWVEWNVEKQKVEPQGIETQKKPPAHSGRFDGIGIHGGIL